VEEIVIDFVPFIRYYIITIREKMMKKNISTHELARVLEPEAFAEADKCDARDQKCDIDTSMKIVKALVHARKALKYIYND